MFLARIDGTVTSTVKHETLEGCRLLIGQRLESDGSSSGDPLVLLDWMGAGRGTTVLVSTDGDVARKRLGNTTPGRLVVTGIVDHVLVGKKAWAGIA
jgi:ethanolamine utilization protein EutN